MRTRLAVLAIALLLAGCAGKPAAREAPARPRPTPSPVPTAIPVPTPVPTPTPVPRELACGAASDCATTPFSRPVRTVADCYCPTCPLPRNAAVARENEVAWQQLCGEWAQRARCVAPMCPRPAAPRCVTGAGGGACATDTSGGS